MGDVTAACVAEIKTDGLFVAERGDGLEIRTADGRLPTADLSPNTDISKHVLDPRLPRPPRRAADHRCWAS